MAVKRTELTSPRSNIVAIDGGKEFWKLPEDLDDRRRRMAQDLLDMIEMRSGVVASDVEQVVIICRTSMRADEQRLILQAALEEGMLRNYATFSRILTATEAAVRRGIADLGMLPTDRASKLSRQVAAKSGQGQGGKWDGLLP